MIKAAIFDMDGTMVNTEHLWYAVNSQLALNHGVTYENGAKVLMMGKKDMECLAAFKEYYNLPDRVEDLVEERRQLQFADTNMLEMCSGLVAFLDLLDRMGVKKAVATASTIRFTDKVLSIFNLQERFDAIVTGDEVAHSKPSPDLFLEAARRINVAPADCLVLEDAQNGIEAAHNAGMFSIALPHQYSRDHDFSLATKILPSMLEIDEALLSSL